jgi:hypothetical protein
MQDMFGKILVPTEEVVEMKGGQKNISERKFFPGYVLVEMDMTDEAWHLVKNTAKVTGFLGADNKPMAISEAEADRIKAMPGQTWLVIEGVRRAAAEPVAVSSLFVPLDFAAIVTSLEGWDGAIHQLIARDFGVHTRRIEQEIAAETLDTATAKTLKAEKGSAGLRTLRRYFDARDNLVLATDSTHPSGRFVYAMTYRLDG